MVGVAIAVVLATLVSAASSQAKIVTVGPTLPMPVEEDLLFGCDTCVLTNLGPTSGASDISPVDGVIIRWHLYAGGPYSKFRLRVLSRQGQEFVGAGRSFGPEFPISELSEESFPTDLPVRAGQVIGLEIEERGSYVLVGYSPGSSPVLLEPAIADGEEGAPPSWWNESSYSRGTVFPFNAEVLPAPTITSVGAAQGPPAGGEQIAIKGENFAEISGVDFGSTAASYVLDSESELTVTVPSGSAGSSVPVSIVTVAGRAEAPVDYTYESSKAVATPATPAPAVAPPVPGCVVPNLKGESLETVRKILSRHGCRLGRVTKRRRATARAGDVKKQSPPAGATLPSGARVDVALGTTH